MKYKVHWLAQLCGIAAEASNPRECPRSGSRQTALRARPLPNGTRVAPRRHARHDEGRTGERTGAMAVVRNPLQASPRCGSTGISRPHRIGPSVTTSRSQRQVGRPTTTSRYHALPNDRLRTPSPSRTEPPGPENNRTPYVSLPIRRLLRVRNPAIMAVPSASRQASP